MKKVIKTTLIAASVILSFEAAQAKPNCQKLRVQQKVDATIGIDFGCAEQLTGTIPEFANYQGDASGICYRSKGRIPAKIGGKAVEFETVSAFLNHGTPASQMVITLFDVYANDAKLGSLYAIDNIHLQDGYEDELFIGGAGQFENAGGIGRLTYTAAPDGLTISFDRLKGEVCLGSGQ